MKNNIKIIAQARGIKLSKLRQYVNMSSSTFSLLVNNKREIDPNTLNTLSDVLSCTPEEILGEKDFNIKLLSSKDVK
ncbi:helix-turn-helix transcriptional regulator, partial [Rickettsiales bacterium]|nr:helix-turn-helix transcriptional regulator [Rickettsiales bacterium]